MNNLKLYSIPASNKILTHPPSQSIQDETSAEQDKLYDTRYYNELLNSIPSEYISPALIVYSMVEQVAVNEEQTKNAEEEKKSDTSLNQVQNLSSEVTNYFGTVIENLALNEVEKHVSLNI